MDFGNKNSYYNLDMSKKFSIILPFKNICDTPKKFKSNENVPREVKRHANTLDIHENYFWKILHYSYSVCYKYVKEALLE